MCNRAISGECGEKVGWEEGGRWRSAVLLLEEKASLEVLQVQLGSGSSLTSLVIEAHLGRESTLRHGLLALGEGPACFLGHLAV